MKKSILQFKKSPISKLFHTPKFYIYLCATGALLTAFSCQVTRGPSDNSPAFSFLGQPATDQPAPVIKFTLVNNPEITAMTLDASACDTDKKDQTLRWDIQIKTIFGNHNVKIDYQPVTTKQEAKSHIGDAHMTIILDEKPTADIIKAACLAYDANPDTATLAIPEVFTHMIRPWLEDTIPDCEFNTLRADGWFCDQVKVVASHGADELLGMKNHMIRRWSRQPYLLTRRLSVARQLALALAAKEPISKLDTICKIIRNSNPAELPIVMTSSRWQKASCEGDAKSRQTAAGIGLSKAIDEIENFKSLFEKTARLGYFSIRIPLDKAPTRTMWVNLIPKDDVKQNLIKGAAKSWQKSDGNVDGLPEFCWHPIFGESGTLNYTARYLALSNEASTAKCIISAEDRMKFETNSQNYLADSISSETEFVVSNFRAKLLRLPQGSYDYTIQGLPDDPSQWDDAANYGPQSNGNIGWTKRRPNPVIRKW
jgi:hypothetical protein